MFVYHGTSKENFLSIEQDGFVREDSYWGSLDIAISYSKHFADGVVLKTELDERFGVNVLLAESLYEDGEIDKVPDTLEESLQELDSVVALEKIRNYEAI